MQRTTVALASIVLATGLVSCKTITEDLPEPTAHSSGSSLLFGPGPAPVPTAAPVALPTPGAAPPAPAPTTPPSGGSPSAPTPTPSSVAPPPSNGGGGSQEGDIPNNDATVARVIAKVAFVECNGAILPDSAYANSAQVGCRVHMDCVAKDASGNPTRARHTPEWHYSNAGLIRVRDSGSGGYTPTLNVQAAGQISISVSIDGVESNSIGMRFE